MKIALICGTLLSQVFYSSCQNTNVDISLRPQSFKIIVPFEINNKGIMVNTYWGTGKVMTKLLWDNDSPTWANEKVIDHNSSISLSKTFFYSTTTADGTPLNGNIYRCDSISLGKVTFTNFLIYKISDQLEGAFGENLITKGIWEINFKKREIIFTSSLDSLKDLQQSEIFSSNFTDDKIKVSVSFRNNKSEDLVVDFGFNGSIILPASDFLKTTKGCNDIYTSILQFSTPSSKNIVQTTNALDTIRIQNNLFRTFISTNKLATEKSIGRGFFDSFEVVIFDYKNKKFYVSKKRS